MYIEADFLLPFYIMTWISYSFVCALHYIIMWNYIQELTIWKMCQVYSDRCVSKIQAILSISFHAINGAVCFELVITEIMCAVSMFLVEYVSGDE